MGLRAQERLLGPQEEGILRAARAGCAKGSPLPCPLLPAPEQPAPLPQPPPWYWGDLPIPLVAASEGPELTGAQGLSSTHSWEVPAGTGTPGILLLKAVINLFQG